MPKGPVEGYRRAMSGGGAAGVVKVPRAVTSQSRAARTYVTKGNPTPSQIEAGRRLQGQMRDRYRDEGRAAGLKAGVKKGAKIAGPVGGAVGAAAGYVAGRSSSTPKKPSGSTAQARKSAVSKAKQIKGR